MPAEADANSVEYTSICHFKGVKRLRNLAKRNSFLRSQEFIPSVAEGVARFLTSFGITRKGIILFLQLS